MALNELSIDLKRAMKTLRLGRLIDTLPERLRIARERQLDPEDLLLTLLTLLTDEIQRRANQRHQLHAHAAGLLPDLVFDRWDEAALRLHLRRVVGDVLEDPADVAGPLVRV